MAITTTALQLSTYGWATNAQSADLSGGETVISAPGTGKSLRLKQVVISSAAAINVTLGGGLAAGAVVTPILGPAYMAQNSSLTFEFSPAVRLADNTALTVDASGAGAVSLFVAGTTE